jgi:hypothetical protein
MATRDAYDNQNLVALRVHTNVHRGRVHRSNPFVHAAPRLDDCWIRKCLSLRATRDRGHDHGGLLSADSQDVERTVTGGALGVDTDHSAWMTV